MPPVRKRKPKSSVKDLVLPNFNRYFFLALIIAILGLFFWVISPFFNVLVYSSLIAVIFHPMHKWFLKKLKGKKTLTAILSTVITVMIFLVPLSLFIFFIAQEAVSAFQLLDSDLANLDVNAFNVDRLAEVPYVGDILQEWAVKYGFEDSLAAIEVDIFALVSNLGESFSSYIVSQTGNIVVSLGNTAISTFILILTLYFLFRDGDEFVAYLKEISPLPKKHEKEISAKLKSTTHGIVIGNFGTSLVQGIAGGIGFAIAGVEHVIFWATVMAFASLIPYVGAAIVWGPVALVMILMGNPWGWFLGIWGAVVVSSVDNIARPFLIGGTAKMHPLATFLAVLGAMILMGIKGIIFGPLILGLAITIIHIYQLEYKKVLKN